MEEREGRGSERTGERQLERGDMKQEEGIGLGRRSRRGGEEGRMREAGRGVRRPVGETQGRGNRGVL